MPFCITAEQYEMQTLCVDLSFVLALVGCLSGQSEVSGLGKLAKRRRSDRRHLWREYTTNMQSMAARYKKRQLHLNSVPTTGYESFASQATALKAELKAAIAVLEDGEGDRKAADCMRTLVEALQALQGQASLDIAARYNMPSPIDDKDTPVRTHDARVGQFNNVVRLVASDLRRKAGSSTNVRDGVAAAVEGLMVPDYPPFK